MLKMFFIFQIGDAVHEQKSFVFVQLWALGRTASPEVLTSEGFELVGPSDIPAKGQAKPRPLTTEGMHRSLSLI